MRLLDLFCGAGGASMGYWQAGFTVVGVDNKRQKRYPFEFIQADALEYLREHGHEFDAIHASPPCQLFTRAQHLRVAQGKTTQALNLIPQTRELLQATGKPYIMENVPGAPLQGVTLCGSSFGLKVRRHRIFETNFPVTQPQCYHKSQGKPVGIYGSLRDEIPHGGHTAKSIEEAREVMEIPWMIWTELKEAIPPAYTEYIGTTLRYQMSARTYGPVIERAMAAAREE